MSKNNDMSISDAWNKSIDNGQRIVHQQRQETEPLETAINNTRENVLYHLGERDKGFYRPDTNYYFELKDGGSLKRQRLDEGYSSAIIDAARTLMQETGMSREQALSHLEAGGGRYDVPLPIQGKHNIEVSTKAHDFLQGGKGIHRDVPILSPEEEDRLKLDGGWSAVDAAGRVGFDPTTEPPAVSSKSWRFGHKTRAELEAADKAQRKALEDEIKADLPPFNTSLLSPEELDKWEAGGRAIDRIDTRSDSFLAMQTLNQLNRDRGDPAAPGSKYVTPPTDTPPTDTPPKDTTSDSVRIQDTLNQLKADRAREAKAYKVDPDEVKKAQERAKKHRGPKEDPLERGMEDQYVYSTPEQRKRGGIYGPVDAIDMQQELDRPWDPHNDFPSMSMTPRPEWDDPPHFSDERKRQLRAGEAATGIPSMGAHTGTVGAASKEYDKLLRAAGRTQLDKRSEESRKHREKQERELLINRPDLGLVGASQGPNITTQREYAKLVKAADPKVRREWKRRRDWRPSKEQAEKRYVTSTPEERRIGGPYHGAPIDLSGFSWKDERDKIKGKIELKGKGYQPVGESVEIMTDKEKAQQKIKDSIELINLAEETDEERKLKGQRRWLNKEIESINRRIVRLGEPVSMPRLGSGGRRITDRSGMIARKKNRNQAIIIRLKDRITELGDRLQALPEPMSSSARNFEQKQDRLRAENPDWSDERINAAAGGEFAVHGAAAAARGAAHSAVDQIALQKDLQAGLAGGVASAVGLPPSISSQVSDWAGMLPSPTVLPLGSPMGFMDPRSWLNMLPSDTSYGLPGLRDIGAWIDPDEDVSTDSQPTPKIDAPSTEPKATTEPKTPTGDDDGKSTPDDPEAVAAALQAAIEDMKGDKKSPMGYTPVEAKQIGPLTWDKIRLKPETKTINPYRPYQPSYRTRYA